MAMPEASIHENDGLPLREDEVGPTWELADVEPKSQTEGMCGASNEKLWARILPAYTPHYCGALCL
jgi:hypothetical protein